MSRIAFVITNKAELNLSHYNNQELGKAKELARRGNDVDIFVYSKRHKGRHRVFAAGGAAVDVVYYWGLPLPGRQTLPLGLRRELARRHYDVAHLHEYPWILPVLAGRFLRRRGTTVVLVQGMYEDFHSPIKRLYNRLYDRILLGALLDSIHGTIFKTTAARAYLGGKGRPTGSSVVIPVGLDRDALETPEELWDIAEDVRASVEVLGSKRLLYIGVLEPRRRPEFLVELLEELVREDPSFALVVVGDGPSAPTFEREVGARGLESHVVMMGAVRQKDLGYVYSSCGLLLLPSRYEIFGMVLLEALNAGMAVLSTPTAGATDILGDSTVSFVQPLELREWAETVRSYFQGGDLFHRENAEYIEKALTWEVLVPRYLRFYEDLRNAESDAGEMR